MKVAVGPTRLAGPWIPSTRVEDVPEEELGRRMAAWSVQSAR